MRFIAKPQELLEQQTGELQKEPIDGSVGDGDAATDDVQLQGDFMLPRACAIQPLMWKRSVEQPPEVYGAVEVCRYA